MAVTARPAGARQKTRIVNYGACAGKNKETVMTKVRSGVFAALGLLFIVLPTAAPAEFRPSAEQRAACTSDAMSLCSAVLMSMDRVVSCLQAKKTQLSPKCRAQFEKGA